MLLLCTSGGLHEKICVKTVAILLLAISEIKRAAICCVIAALSVYSCIVCLLVVKYKAIKLGM